MAITEAPASFEEIRTLAEIGLFRLILAKTEGDGQAQLALILDGPDPASGFAVLAQMQDTTVGAALAGLVAKAVEAAFAHAWDTEIATPDREAD